MTPLILVPWEVKTRSIGLAGCLPSSGLNERPHLRGIRHREMEQGTGYYSLVFYLLTHMCVYHTHQYCTHTKVCVCVQNNANKGPEPCRESTEQILVVRRPTTTKGERTVVEKKVKVSSPVATGICDALSLTS